MPFRGMICIHFGARMRAIREARGLLQSNLAEAAGVSVSQISRYEQGKDIPDAIRVAPILTVLECYYRDLLEDPSAPVPGPRPRMISNPLVPELCTEIERTYELMALAQRRWDRKLAELEHISSQRCESEIRRIVREYRADHATFMQEHRERYLEFCRKAEALHPIFRHMTTMLIKQMDSLTAAAAAAAFIC